jgi:hypothetical protein
MGGWKVRTDVAGGRKLLRRYGKGLSSEEEVRTSKVLSGEEGNVNMEFMSLIVSKVTSAVVECGRKTVK